MKGLFRWAMKDVHVWLVLATYVLLKIAIEVSETISLLA